MKTNRFAGGWLIAAVLAAGWMLPAPIHAADAGGKSDVQSNGKGPKKPGPGVMGADGRVMPPPLPGVVTHVHPGVPNEDLTEANHERGTNFNVGQFRKADGSVHRD
ncbi:MULTISPECIES: hypothetical protein [Ralstonia solanacearum species complex]|uniref:Uncharacterized protein n=3 Tax=Ralstonia solanacearum species complex TaxID=3116862 RepID=A0A454TQD1_9RALS|nr:MULTISPECIES: hypothetical protein [Ralstonia]AKZ28517.1 hypothetical protein ACH51_19420 [Ralstonia solanacearum]APC66209.1 hypothetical protein RSOE_02175 [Ralstonia solanacearum OE1-1]APF89004.1 hypothetical protein BCR16_19290 [Ralstonia solanacearum FJAT-1458]ARS58125.1 hypothetical protein BC427_18130 [Ralstonia solanacearum FJAT-91]ESS50716.1 putative signal peptide protein [Ralstonia solanacearum SD54]